jgi:hypothetical protein
LNSEASDGNHGQFVRDMTFVSISKDDIEQQKISELSAMPQGLLNKVPDDLELRFDWKVSAGCNSGVYYRPGQVEYQVLDNQGSPYGENARQAAASLFFCMAPSKDATHPVGQWNTARIICQGSVIEHWLNDERVLSFDYNAPKWKWYVELLAARGGDLTGRKGQLWLQDRRSS